MGEIETSGFKAWWPLKEFQGRTGDGKNVVIKGFRNMVTGEFHADTRGWDGAPPRPSGDLSNVRHVSDHYRENYDQISWERKAAWDKAIAPVTETAVTKLKKEMKP